MRSPIDRLITGAAIRATTHNDSIIDMAADGDLSDAIKIKNVCAKLSEQLSDEIDSVCGMLDIRKRRFIEAALMEALDKAYAIIEAEGVHEHYQSQNEAYEAHKAKNSGGAA